MRQSTSIDPVSDAQAQDALQRSQDFLQRRLIPDAKRIEHRRTQLESSRKSYADLHRQAQAMLAAPSSSSSSGARLAPLGLGVHVPVDVTPSPTSTIIVSMGLGQMSETAWTDSDQPPEQNADAGLFVELTLEEAATFSAKKMAILDKKIKSAREREALIQGHIELTSKSIEQLEALQQNPSSNFLDYLRSD